jgi:hypothetical protein
MTQHAGMRFICFMIYSGLLASMPKLVVIFAPLMLLLCWYQCSLPGAWMMLKRLRWLFLSLLLVSLLFPLHGYAWPGVLYSLAFAAERIIVLVLLVLAAHWLVSHSSLSELVAGLDWLLHPLARWGANRFSLRLSLTLETVKQATRIYQDLAPLPATTPRLYVWPGRLKQLFKRVLEAAEQAELVTLEIPQLGKPGWRDWLSPLGILLLGIIGGGVLNFPPLTAIL